MLRYEPSDNGDAYVINRYAGDDKVTPDTNSKAYIDFRCFLQGEPHDLRRGARLFETAEELVAFCKSQNFVLKATENLHLEYDVLGGFLTRPSSERAFDAAEIDGELCQLDELQTISQKGLYSNMFVLPSLNISMAKSIRDEKSDIRRISNLPISRAFVYFDVSDFSKHNPVDQLLVINSLAKIVKTDWMWNFYKEVRMARDNCEAQLCIGDGYIYVFSSQVSAIAFAAHLAGLVEALEATGKLPVEFHFRMGVDAGKVRCFFDPGREDWNYIGDGINDAQRILSSIEPTTDDVLYISWRTRKELISNPEDQYCSILHSNTTNKGRRADKHGKMRRVYEINFSNVFNSCRSQFVNFLASNR